MNRYTVLMASTVLAVGAVLLSGRLVKNSIVRVSAVRMAPATAEETILCTGTVESLEDSKVYATSSGEVEKIYVKEGDAVKRGEHLMDVAVPSGYSQPQVPTEYQMYSSYLNQSQAASSSGNRTETLTAPADGTVRSVSVEEGMYVGTTEPAAVIKSSRGVQVRLSVEESQISEMKVGQPAQITGAGFQDSVYSGAVESISNEAKQLTTASGVETVVEAVVSVKNPGSDIKPGFTAKAKITTSKSSHMLILPYEAVCEDDAGNEFVYRFVSGRAVKTTVLTGKEFDTGFEIRQGLKAGDVAITNPDSVSSGARVVPTISKAVVSVG